MFRMGVSVRDGLAPLLAVLTALAILSPAAAQTVNYPNFSSVAGLTLNGNASQAAPMLRLTSSTTWQSGSAFLTNPIVLRADGSFCTQFSFQMPDPGGWTDSTDGYIGADGIVFAIQKNGSNALGNNGGYLGYFTNPSQPAVSPITSGVGVEFDSWWNGSDSPFNDSNGNHVAVNNPGSSLAGVAVGTRLNDGTVYYAWVDYNGVTDKLDVYLSQSAVRPNTPTLTYPIDLGASLGGGVNVYPGFTSGTGVAFNRHEIRSWQLSTEPCVPVDLKPGSNPNCVNRNANGVVSVGILKTDLFDPATLNPNTVTFGGASALRCGFEDADADGDLDLTCQFNSKDVAWPAAGTNCGIVALTAGTTSGTTLTSHAVACLAGESTCNAGTPVGSEYIAAP